MPRNFCKHNFKIYMNTNAEDRLTLCERSIRAARNIELWGEGDNPIGSSLLTFEELSSIVARLIVKILPRYDLS